MIRFLLCLFIFLYSTVAYSAEYSFWGYLTSTGLNTANEADSRFLVYRLGPAGEPLEITTLGAKDVFLITDVVIASVSNNYFEIYSGADATIDGGERTYLGRTLTSNNNIIGNIRTPHYTVPGTFPKAKASGAGLANLYIAGKVLIY